jgi:hypothetical protein
MKTNVTWIELATKLADEMDQEYSTHERRKVFKSGDGPARAQKQIKALDALRIRFSKFV